MSARHRAGAPQSGTTRAFRAGRPTRSRGAAAGPRARALLRQGRKGATDPAVHLLAPPLDEDGDGAVRRNPARGGSDVSMTTATPATKMKPIRAGVAPPRRVWHSRQPLQRGSPFTSSCASRISRARRPPPSLREREKAPLAKTGMQLATWMEEAKAASGVPDLTRSAAILAVRSGAARTLDDLEAGCRAFDLLVTGRSQGISATPRNVRRSGNGSDRDGGLDRPYWGASHRW